MMLVEDATSSLTSLTTLLNLLNVLGNLHAYFLKHTLV